MKEHVRQQSTAWTSSAVYTSPPLLPRDVDMALGSSSWLAKFWFAIKLCFSNRVLRLKWNLHHSNFENLEGPTNESGKGVGSEGMLALCSQITLPSREQNTVRRVPLHNGGQTTLTATDSKLQVLANTKDGHHLT